MNAPHLPSFRVNKEHSFVSENSVGLKFRIFHKVVIYQISLNDPWHCPLRVLVSIKLPGITKMSNP